MKFTKTIFYKRHKIHIDALMGFINVYDINGNFDYKQNTQDTMGLQNVIDKYIPYIKIQINHRQNTL